jgi:hypothetical protein
LITKVLICLFRGSLDLLSDRGIQPRRGSQSALGAGPFVVVRREIPVIGSSRLLKQLCDVGVLRISLVLQIVVCAIESGKKHELAVYRHRVCLRSGHDSLHLLAVIGSYCLLLFFAQSNSKRHRHRRPFSTYLIWSG